MALSATVDPPPHVAYATSLQLLTIGHPATSAPWLCAICSIGAHAAHVPASPYSEGLNAGLALGDTDGLTVGGS